VQTEAAAAEYLPVLQLAQVAMETALVAAE
jgi:hypothetical protein